MDARVIIVGAGPVGLTIAAELARNGLRCRVLDRNPGPSTESRAVAVQPRTLEVFASMGIIDRILPAGHRVHGVNLFAESQRILHFSLDELASAYPFGLDLPQSETQRILAEHLRGFGIEVDYGATVTGVDQDASGVELFAQPRDARTRVLHAEYVIGCDGAHSAVRHLLGVPLEGESGEESFLIADAQVDWDGADDEWYLWFHEDGLLALFPLPGGLYRVVADVDPSSPDTTAELRAIFARRGPRHAQLADPVWLSHFKLTRRRAVEYQRGRVFVAGDAAHVHSPAGGQGMNSGVQDAFNLAWKLSMVLRGNAPESLLESYTAEREPVARSVLALTDNLSGIATLRHPVSQGIRNRLIPILAGLEVFEHRLVDRLAEISINYRRSPIVGQSGRWYTAEPLPGDRAAGLFDLITGARHVVLLFTGEHPETQDLRGFANIARYMRDGYPDEVTTHLIAREDVEWSGSKVIDRDGRAHYAYSAGTPCVYLIRPDGYVGFRSLSSDPLPLLEHLNRVYEPPLATEISI